MFPQILATLLSFVLRYDRHNRIHTQSVYMYDRMYTTDTEAKTWVCLFVCSTAATLTLPKSWERIRVVRSNKVTVKFPERSWHYRSEFGVIRIHRKANQKAIEQNTHS